MNTMYAAVLHAPNDLRYEEVPIPVLSDNDVLVQVTACGVCGSDLPRVLTTGTYHFPTIPGHEFGGVIAAVGRNVPSGFLGRRVGVIPLIPCRTCKQCEIGQFAQCEHYDFLGSRSDGGFAQYARVPKENLVFLPDSVDDVSAAMLEPISVALHAVKNAGIKAGDNVAVFGLGAIGMFIAQWAKAYGANHVFALDIDQKKVDTARACGLEEGICLRTSDANGEILKKTGGIGVDAAIEASGAVPAFAQAIDLLRVSGTLCLVGRPTGDGVIPNKAYEKLLRNQLRIQGSWSFAFQRFPHHDWEESLLAIQAGKILTAPLVTQELPLSSTFEAIQTMAKREVFVHKIIIRPSL